MVWDISYVWKRRVGIKFRFKSAIKACFEFLLVATYYLYDSFAKILHIAFFIKFSSEILRSAKTQATKIY